MSIGITCDALPLVISECPLITPGGALFCHNYIDPIIDRLFNYWCVLIGAFVYYTIHQTFSEVCAEFFGATFNEPYWLMWYSLLSRNYPLISPLACVVVRLLKRWALASFAGVTLMAVRTVELRRARGLANRGIIAFSDLRPKQ